MSTTQHRSRTAVTPRSQPQISHVKDEVTMSKTRVVVTGLGATTPLGGDVSSTWEGLLAGLRRPAADRRLGRGPAGARSPHRSRSTRPRCSSGSRPAGWTVGAVRDGRGRGGLGRLRPGGRRDRPGAARRRDGVRHRRRATTLLELRRLLKKGPRRVSPLGVPMLMPNAPAANVSLDVGARAGGPHPGLGLRLRQRGRSALGLDQIRLGRADVVVAGGTEAAIHPLPMAAFADDEALIEAERRPDPASRPWDVARDGFVLGEGAGVLVLESEEHAKARGATDLRRGRSAPGSPPTRTTSPSPTRPVAAARGRWSGRCPSRRPDARPTSSTSTPTPRRPRRATSPRPDDPGRRSASTPTTWSSPAPSR